MTDTTTTAEILVQDTLGRVRTPREKRERILDEYERSGMSGAAIAAWVGGEVSDVVLMDPAAAQGPDIGEPGHVVAGALGGSGGRA
jgi:hypothetical protein